MNKYLILSVVIIGLLIGFNGHAVDFNVTITDDTVDANLGDDLCLDSNGECSLRTAINQSNFLISDDVIYYLAENCLSSH